jgi:hypothetical protein
MVDDTKRPTTTTTTLSSLLRSNVIKLRTGLLDRFPHAEIDVLKYVGGHTEEEIKLLNESLLGEMSVDVMNDVLSAGIYNNDKSVFRTYKDHSFCKVICVPMVVDEVSWAEEEWKVIVFPYAQTILQFYTLLTATGSVLECMEDIARTFISEHPNMLPGDYQQTLLKSLLTNDKMRKKLAETLNDVTTLPTIIGNVVTIMKGMNIYGTKPTLVLEEEDDPITPDDTLSSMYKQQKKNRRKAKQTKQQEDPFEMITKMMSDTHEMEEVSVEIQKALNGDNNILENMLSLIGDGKGGLDINKVMSSMSGCKELNPIMQMYASKFSPIV